MRRADIFADGLPWARAAFNIAAYTLLPFGYFRDNDKHQQRYESHQIRHVANELRRPFNIVFESVAEITQLFAVAEQRDPSKVSGHEMRHFQTAVAPSRRRTFPKFRSAAWASHSHHSAPPGPSGGAFSCLFPLDEGVFFVLVRPNRTPPVGREAARMRGSGTGGLYCRVVRVRRSNNYLSRKFLRASSLRVTPARRHSPPRLFGLAVVLVSAQKEQCR